MFGPRRLLRLEGAALLAAALVGYARTDEGWLFLFVLVLAPDLAALAYLIGPRAGTVAYNLAHTTVGPLILLALAVIVDAELPLRFALVWLAHIGLDRAVGYGLKYSPTRGDTHLQRV